MVLDAAGETAVREVAAEARRRHDKKMNILDRAAIKLCVEIDCGVHAVPLRVEVNGVIQPGVLEVSTSNEPCREEYWLDVPIRSGGPDKIRVQVVPTGEAARYFRSASTRALRYSSAFTRNIMETYSLKYRVPPDDGKQYEESQHLIELKVAPKRRLWSRKKIPERFFLKSRETKIN